MEPWPSLGPLECIIPDLELSTRLEFRDWLSQLHQRCGCPRHIQGRFTDYLRSLRSQGTSTSPGCTKKRHYPTFHSPKYLSHQSVRGVQNPYATHPSNPAVNMMSNKRAQNQGDLRQRSLLSSFTPRKMLVKACPISHFSPMSPMLGRNPRFIPGKRFS